MTELNRIVCIRILTNFFRHDIARLKTGKKWFIWHWRTKDFRYFWIYAIRCRWSNFNGNSSCSLVRSKWFFVKSYLKKHEPHCLTLNLKRMGNSLSVSWRLEPVLNITTLYRENVPSTPYIIIFYYYCHTVICSSISGPYKRKRIYMVF